MSGSGIESGAGVMRRDEVERLYEQYGPALLAYASAILHQRAAAEDILHQVFLKLMKQSSARTIPA